MGGHVIPVLFLLRCCRTSAFRYAVSHSTALRCYGARTLTTHPLQAKAGMVFTLMLRLDDVSNSGASDARNKTFGILLADTVPGSGVVAWGCMKAFLSLCGPA
jgi:hypothetical protein